LFDLTFFDDASRSPFESLIEFYRIGFKIRTELMCFVVNPWNRFNLSSRATSMNNRPNRPESYLQSAINTHREVQKLLTDLFPDQQMPVRV